MSKSAKLASLAAVQNPCTDAGTLARQAGVTDDVPLHVLAGNVVPLAKGHHMTTVDVQNSSLVLVVAVPKDNVAAPAVRRFPIPCGHQQSGIDCNIFRCQPCHHWQEAIHVRARADDRQNAGN